MKNNSTQIICSLAFAGLFFLSSCGTIYYAPNQPNLPMVKDKGITKVNGSIGFGELSSAFDVNVFHSVSNSVGVMGNFSSMYLDGNELNSLDLGAGYFNAFDESSGFEIYSTVGYGKLKMTDYNLFGPDYSSSSPVYRFSIQPDIFYAGKHFEAGFGIRLHYFSFGNTPMDYDYAYNTTYNYSYSNAYEAVSKNNLMFEPTIRMAFGGEKAKASLQGTYSQKINEGYLNYDPFVFSVGFSIKIGASDRPRPIADKR